MIFYSKTRYFASLWGKASLEDDFAVLENGVKVPVKPLRSPLFSVVALLPYLVLSVVALALGLAIVEDFTDASLYVAGTFTGLFFYASFFEKDYFFPISFFSFAGALLASHFLDVVATVPILGFWEGLSLSAILTWSSAKVTKDGLVYVEVKVKKEVKKDDVKRSKERLKKAKKANKS